MLVLMLVLMLLVMSVRVLKLIVVIRVIQNMLKSSLTLVEHALKTNLKHTKTNESNACQKLIEVVHVLGTTNHGVFTFNSS